MAKPKRQTGELDKFYTNRQAALWLKERTYSMLGPTLPAKKLEPSAGSGAFLEPGDDIVAFDKLPHHERAMQLDDSGHPWIIEMMAYVMSDWPRKELLTLGNPPFGVRGSDAIRFLNVYLQVGGLVAFVLPIVLRKWAGQRRVIKSARLIADWDLPPDMFHLPDGTPYKLECCFQIWSTRETDHRFDDLRIVEEPIKTHPGFEMWNAKGASHAGWSKDFDFATLCNGGAATKSGSNGGTVPRTIGGTCSLRLERQRHWPY